METVKTTKTRKPDAVWMNESRITIAPKSPQIFAAAQALFLEIRSQKERSVKG